MQGQRISTSRDLAEVVTKKVWTKNSSSRLHCTIQKQSIAEILDKLQQDFQTIAHHIGLKRIQAEEFAKDKKNEAVQILQIDFAMNFSCEYQNEVQSAVWSRGSVTLFTAAAMHKGNCQTYLICSDTKDKEKNAVTAFVKHLYREGKSRDPVTMVVPSHFLFTFGFACCVMALSYSTIFKLFRDEITVLEKGEKHLNANDVAFFNKTALPIL